MGSAVVVSSVFPVVDGLVRLTALSLERVEAVHSAPGPAELAAMIEGTRPLLVVIDLDPVGVDPFGRVRAVRSVDASVPIVAMSTRSDGALVLRSLRFGVRAYVVKPDGLRDMGAVLERVLAGERVFDPEIEQAAVLALGRLARHAREGSELLGSLTLREVEVLQLLSEGITMQQIGRRLGISARTVETHTAKLYRKLGVRTRMQAVAKATALDLIDLT